MALTVNLGAMVTRLLLASLLGACGDFSVPRGPTYFEDVQPIVRENCAPCHGPDPIDPKVAAFRLDRYVKHDLETLDLHDFATGSDPALRRAAVDRSGPAMPPDGPLPDRERDLLDRWIAEGAPKGSRENHAPRIELLAPFPPTTVAQMLELRFRAWDDDLDGLIVDLWARDLATAQHIALGHRSGEGKRGFRIDTSQLASRHRFEIFAILDDGFSDDPMENREIVTLVPDLLVYNGLSGTAPTVKLVTPPGRGTEIGTIPITWTATDPDLDPVSGEPDALTIDLDLVRVSGAGTETVIASIASGLTNTGSFSWEIPTSVPVTDGSGNQLAYRVRVTARDSFAIPPNTRSDSNGFTFAIQHGGTTTFTWADVEPIFTTYCAACHGNPAVSAFAEYFCLLQYQKGAAVPPCGVGDLGVLEMKGLVFSRFVTDQNMPPGGGPSAAERAIVGNWMKGGAP